MCIFSFLKYIYKSSIHTSSKEYSYMNSTAMEDIVISIMVRQASKFEMESERYFKARWKIRFHLIQSPLFYLISSRGKELSSYIL